MSLYDGFQSQGTPLYPAAGVTPDNGSASGNVAAGAGIGALGGFAGSLISGLGQQKGAEALARQTQLQMQQQQALQQQADNAMGTFLGNNQPGQTQQTATEQAGAPAQQYLQKLNGYKPAALSGAAGNTFAAASNAGTNDLQSANARLARVNGLGQAQSLAQQGKQNLGSTVGNLQLQNQRNEQLAPLQNAIAGSQGSGLRFLGGLTSAVGQSAGGAAMMM